jgi:hypothetical protein
VSEDVAAIAPVATSNPADEKRFSHGGVIGWIVALAYLALCGILYGLT